MAHLRLRTKLTWFIHNPVSPPEYFLTYDEEDSTVFSQFSQTVTEVTSAFQYSCNNERACSWQVQKIGSTVEADVMAMMFREQQKVRGGVSRRAVLGALIGSAVLMSMQSSEASGGLGFVVKVRGNLSRSRNGDHEAMNAGTPLIDGDFVSTASESFAELKLGGDTRILLGPETSLYIDSFLAGQGGVLELAGGQMIFDRPEGLPKIDVSVRTAFGMIGVRGTKFFAGPNRGAFAVYVEHGKVDVTNAGVSRKLLGGQGLDIRPPESATRSLGQQSSMEELSKLAIPSLPVVWDNSRISEVYASVGLE